MFYTESFENVSYGSNRIQYLISLIDFGGSTKRKDVKGIGLVRFCSRSEKVFGCLVTARQTFSLMVFILVYC